MDKTSGRLKRLSLSLAYLVAVGIGFTALLGTGLTVFIGQ